MDNCHLQNAELEPKYQKCKGQVVLRVDTVKTTQVLALYTEQGSSASQMTAVKVMDVIARLPDCAGQAADAASAFTQVHMEDASKLLCGTGTVIHNGRTMTVGRVGGRTGHSSHCVAILIRQQCPQIFEVDPTLLL